MSENTVIFFFFSNIAAPFKPEPSNIIDYMQRSSSFVFWIPRSSYMPTNPSSNHLKRQGWETHPKISAENMRVASSYQKNALNTFAK